MEDQVLRYVFFGLSEKRQMTKFLYVMYWGLGTGTGVIPGDMLNTVMSGKVWLLLSTVWDLNPAFVA